MKIACAALLFLSLVPALSQACTCMFPTFEEQMKKATAVFHAKVINVKEHQESGKRIELEVKKSWKGSLERTVSVYTAHNTSACGYPFELEKEYLIYATGDKELQVGLCSLTKQISEASGDLNLLQEPFRKKDAKRDPFTEMKGERTKQEEIIPKALNITNAVIVGITKKSDAYIALIRGTNNKVYFLRVGDKLHDGVVFKIDRNSVTFPQKRGHLVRKQLRPFPDD